MLDGRQRVDGVDAPRRKFQAAGVHVAHNQPVLAVVDRRKGSGVSEHRFRRLDRGKLGRIIFADPVARGRLNAITHPRIRERMAAEIAARTSRPGVLIVDIPLLYENDRTATVEAVIVVWVDPTTQLRRLNERGGLTVDEARQRIAAQMPLDEKRARADVVIDNTGSRENTRRQVEAIYRQYAPAT